MLFFFGIATNGPDILVLCVFNHSRNFHRQVEDGSACRVMEQWLRPAAASRKIHEWVNI